MWLLPSRGRPASLARFFDAYRHTGGSTPGVVLVSQWDQPNYGGIDLPLGWSLAVTNHESQGDKLAEIWDQVKDCAWLGLIGDDCVPMTPGWDKALLDALDGANFVSCNDDWLAPHRAANCWVMSGELVRRVGYIFPPGLQHLFVDDVWETIGRETRCWACRMDILVKHQHVLAGQAAADDTHRLVYGSDTSDTGAGLWPQDGATYQRWLNEGGAARAIAAVRELRAGHADTPIGEVTNRLEIDPEQGKRLEYCRGRSVMLLTPIHERPAWQFTVAYAETLVMLEQLRIRYASRFVVGSSNLPKARNILAARFLASGLDDCLMIDDDMGWTANSALRLMASDQPLIAGVGRKKVDKPNTDPNVWCCHFDPAEGGRLQQDQMGNVKLPRVGTGFMKISRVVFEQMMAAHPEWKREGDPAMEPAVRQNYYQFFKFDDERELGEDYLFCERWRELGGEVYIDPSILLSHTGQHSWSGRISELMVPAEPDPPPRSHGAQAA